MSLQCGDYLLIQRPLCEPPWQLICLNHHDAHGWVGTVIAGHHGRGEWFVDEAGITWPYLKLTSTTLEGAYLELRLMGINP